MMRRLAMMGLQKRNLLVYVLIAAGSVAVATVQMKLWGFITSADRYSRLLSRAVGTMASWAYAALQIKSAQQLLASSVVVRFRGRISCAGFILRRNLYCAVFMAALLNLITTYLMKNARALNKNFVPALLLCLVFQIAYFFVIATLEQVLFLLLRNWYAALIIVVLYISVDFILPVIMAEKMVENPFYIGWDMTLLPLNGVWQLPTVLFGLFSLGTALAFMIILSRADLLNYDKRVAK